MADYTSTGIITDLKNAGLIPTSQKTYENDDFIDFMDRELRLHIVPKIMSTRANYFLGDPYDQSVVSGTSNYALPPRAIGMMLKNVFFLDAAGNEKELTLIEVDDLPDLNTQQTGEPEFFYFKDNEVVIRPPPAQSVGSIRMYYYVRRSQIIDILDCGKITQNVAGVLTLNNVPTTFTTSVQFDLVKGTPGFQTLKMDITPSAVSATTITFSTSDIPSTVAVGDYVCLAQESPIAQIPLEFHPWLTQRVLFRVLRGINDRQGAEDAKDDLKEIEESAMLLLATRADEQSKKIVSTHNIGNYVLGNMTNRW